MTALAETIAALPAHVIRQGDSGEAVAAAQKALAAIGYHLKGSGYFGTLTDTAVVDFQRIHNLKRDGVIGRVTAAMLDEVWTRGPIAPAATMHTVTRPPWQLAGLALLNTREVPGAGDNLEILAWAKEEGGAIARDFHHDATAWCSLFKNHQLTRAELRGTETLWALDWADPHKWPCVKLAGPAVGAIAAMKRLDGRGRLIGGHVIDVFGKDQHGNVMGLGGNQGNEVSIRPFPRSRLELGFFWPAGYPAPAAATIGFEHLPLVTSDGRLSTAEA